MIVSMEPVWGCKYKDHDDDAGQCRDTQHLTLQGNAEIALDNQTALGANLA